MNIPIEDRFEMMDTVAKYYTYADLGMADEFLETFTPDGVLDVIMPGATEVWSPEGYLKRWAGHDELRAMVLKSAPEVFGRPHTQGLHHSSNFFIEEFSPTAAKSRNYMLHTIQMSPPDVRDGAGPLMLTHGYYLDDWVKYEGHWRFKYRSYRPAGYHPIYFPGGYRPDGYQPMPREINDR